MARSELSAKALSITQVGVPIYAPITDTPDKKVVEKEKQEATAKPSKKKLIIVGVWLVFAAILFIVYRSKANGK